jgi:membrane protein DedA with SNARE-associated domain
MPSLHTISDLALAHPHLIYIILFPLALIEGPVLALVVGFLVKLGYLDIFAAYTVMVAGDFFPDSFYYYIGKLAHKKGWIERLSKKFTSKAGFILDNRDILEKLWKNHGKKMMLFSKQAYGLSTPLLVSAGLVNMSYRRFLAYAFPITLAQYIVFITIGYWLGYSYTVAGPYIQYAGWAVALFVIAFIAVYIFVQKRARKALMNMEKGEDGEKMM